MPTLQFKGKTAVETYHYTVPHHTLGFDAAASVLDAGQTPSLEGNVILEGDNLLALKALLPTHTGRIKCIYIDPPYNTGNEGWVYNDNLTQPQFKEWIGQVVGKDGEDACRHDKWCCMMYPRLMLLKELLRDDGVIFISIDDNEVAHLRLLMNEVFGEENFVAQITVVTNPKGRVMSRHFAETHDHIIVFGKSAISAEFSVEKAEDQVAREYTEIDADGRFRTLELRNTHREFGRFNRPNLYYPIYVNPQDKTVSLVKGKENVEVYPIWEDGFEGCWTWATSKATEELKLLVAREIGSRWKIFRKSYAINVEGENARMKLKTVWTDASMYTEKGQAVLEAILPGRVFPNPKAVNLVKSLLRTSLEDEDIILDSFAGSGTTGQAVLELNKEDSGNRKFVLVQQKYDSKDDEKKKLNIAETITAERVRHVIQGTGVPATGGGFTYARVSDTPLFGEYRDLGETPPPYEDLAKYIFYTETSRQWDPAGMDTATGKIGTLNGVSYFLLYTPDGEANAALDLKWLGSVAAADPNSRLVVYCEKFWMHRDELRRWEADTHKSVRTMIVPFQLK